jgi:mannitol-1-phosphate 5-dehydrogenase
MSGAVEGGDAIARRDLRPMTDGADKAFLVESFNRILISRISIPGFTRGIDAFEEKPDLLPFEEAKLYGHNATHALIGYLAHRQGYDFMPQASESKPLMALARDAFLEESGRTLIARHDGVDDLFTTQGYRRYALDLLDRMVNPFLRDSVDRVVRDPRRKLGWNDRFFGIIRLAISAGLTPWRYAAGAALALNVLERETGKSRETLLKEIWTATEAKPDEKHNILHLLRSSEKRLDDIL